VLVRSAPNAECGAIGTAPQDDENWAGGLRGGCGAAEVAGAATTVEVSGGCQDGW
jgi:hypothetical protein